MAEQEKGVAIDSSQLLQGPSHILQLNDVFLLKILRYLSPMQLCDIGETCKRFKKIARDEFKRQVKVYGIPSGVRFTDHPRVLRNFKDLIQEVSLTYFIDLGKHLDNIFPNMLATFLGNMNSVNMERVFNWLERYCSETLQSLKILNTDDMVFPPSALRLMAQIKRMKLQSSISFENSRDFLRECKELVELDMPLYDGPFNLTDFHFPHLRKLRHRVRVTHAREFMKIDKFFKNHPKLIELCTQFHFDSKNRKSINLSYIGHLVDLEKLELLMGGADIIGMEAFANLKKIKELSFDASKDVRANKAILENLVSLDLVKLHLGFSEIDALIDSIGKFDQLSELVVTHNMLPFGIKLDVNISCLAQLRNSRLTELKISCNELLEPESIVDVICNLIELKKATFSCKIELSETICMQLANVCSDQGRKVVLILCKDIKDDMDFDFTFIDKFNQFTEIKFQSMKCLIASEY